MMRVGILTTGKTYEETLEAVTMAFSTFPTLIGGASFALSAKTI